MNGMGRTLIVLGLVLLAAGLYISFGLRIPWLGKLPGDIAVRRENFSFYFPLTTCILLSVLISLILWLFRR